MGMRFLPNSYGIWLPVRREDGQLATKEDGFACEGGEFAVPSFRSFVDFNKCDGCVEIIWRGKTDLHATCLSKTEPNFTSIGSSVQINKTLATACLNKEVVDSVKLGSVGAIIEDKKEKLKQRKEKGRTE